MSTDPGRTTPPFREATAHCRWDGVEILAYKEEGSAPFRSVTRQVLFSDPSLAGELRYFEVAPGGHTTLERHQHAHGVMVLRGRARALVFPEVRVVSHGDLVFIPALTWHQFRTEGDQPFGFLCMVDAVRDRPQLPDASEREALCAVDAVRAFLEGDAP
ncbi:cupin domain-containing protein [Phaeovibrio sulfidiphilus]|uniref:Cupin domain-containing protein n=1 Tax=Phaeovibrio sulfidiphilus TaxID=1220600 RepID=A0A8J6YKH2_9PROT|nr:cupin domain-containing protein [Phaeovibrio sulfidiphilus]